MVIRATKMAGAVQAAFDEGYRVRSDGCVLSPFGRLMRPHIQRNGYARVQCNKHAVYIHQLAAFQKFGVAALEVGMQVRHMDGNRLDSREDNIQIGSAAQNHHDIPAEVRHRITIAATTASGLKKRKLTPENVAEIFVLRAAGWSLRRTAARFSVSKPVIQLILAGRTYRELTTNRDQKEG